MFEGIISFFKKFGKGELQDAKSKDMAKERLHLVLMQDRANVSADFLEMMKQDKGKTLIPVYSKLDAYKLPEEFAMLQAQSMDKVGAIQDLSRGVKKIVQEYKTEDVEEIDKETILKVSQALEEARSIGEGRYEVNIVKENLPIWYYILCIGTLVFYGLERFLVSFAYDFNLSGI